MNWEKFENKVLENKSFKTDVDKVVILLVLLNKLNLVILIIFIFKKKGTRTHYFNVYACV